MSNQILNEKCDGIQVINKQQSFKKCQLCSLFKSEYRLKYKTVEKCDMGSRVFRNGTSPSQFFKSAQNLNTQIHNGTATQLETLPILSKCFFA